MASYEGNIVINAPVSDVFEYVNAPATLPDWMSALVEVRNVIGSGAGLQWEWTYKMVGIHVRGESVIVDYVHNERATHQGIGMLAANWTNIERIDGTAAADTRGLGDRRDPRCGAVDAFAPCRGRCHPRRRR